MHLAALVEQLDNHSVDDIYGLIASNRIFIDFHAAPLAKPDRVRVFRDAATARAFQLVGIAERTNGRLNADNNGRLVRASPTDLREANRRYAIRAPYLTGTPVGNITTPKRTIVIGWRAGGWLSGSMDTASSGSCRG